MAGSRKFVIPGDLITSGPFRPEDNVVFDGKNITSTAVGMSEIFNDSVRVMPLSGMYYPKVGDTVVGKVVSHTSLSWNVDIRSCYVGFLPATDVFGRDFSSHADELGTKLVKGDLIAARIANFDRTRDPMISISDRDLGRIDSGDLVEFTPGKIPRLIGKRGSMIQMIEEATGTMITVGQNGLVVVSGEDSDGLLRAKKAITMVEEQSHTENLTDRVKAAAER